MRPRQVVGEPVVDHVLLNRSSESIQTNQMMPGKKPTTLPAWATSLLLAVVTLALYWPVRHYDFVEYDDPDYVFENQTVRSGLSWYGLEWSLVDAHASNWHPVTWLSHMLDCEWFGLNPGAHHLVNAVLHAANSALLFLLILSMTGAFWRSALVAAFFAWHPLRVESVAWISERKDVLSGFFFMLTLLSYSKYAAAKAQDQAVPSELEGCGNSAEAASCGSAHSNPSRLWYNLTLVFFLLGLLSKPMLVTVPCLLLLLDDWPLNRLPRPAGAAWAFPRELLLEKVPFLLLTAGVACLTVLAQRQAMIPLQAESLGSRIVTILSGYFGYFRNTFWPHDLAVLYLRSERPPIGPLLGGIVLLIGVSAAAVWNWRTRPYLAVGWLWFLAMLMPVCGLVQTGLQSIADRYTYLPAIGLGLLVAWSLGDLALCQVRAQIGRALTAVLAGAALLACLWLTRQQLAYWQNTQTLMEHALKVDPDNYVAHQDLARYYTKKGQVELAREHRQKVRVLDPGLRVSADSDAR